MSSPFCPARKNTKNKRTCHVPPRQSLERAGSGAGLPSLPCFCGWVCSLHLCRPRTNITPLKPGENDFHYFIPTSKESFQSTAVGMVFCMHLQELSSHVSQPDVATPHACPTSAEPSCPLLPYLIRTSFSRTTILMSSYSRLVSAQRSRTTRNHFLVEISRLLPQTSQR